MHKSQTIYIMLALIVLALSPITVLSQESCPNNRLANASFEEGARNTGEMGTRPSSIVATGWNPWSVWGYAPYSQEAEFDIEDITHLGRYSTYRVHSGRFSQKSSSSYAVHMAGLYQRVAVPKGSTVIFSIWVQIYTGQESSVSAGELVSDLNHPGNYRVYVGIDPYGREPAGFGAPPPEDMVWSDPVIDRETRRVNEQGLPYDAWVQLKVTAKAAADHITVYTKGQPEFAVAHNVSYWDDACLSVTPPKATSTPTTQFTPTARPTQPPTLTPTIPATATLTETPLPTATPSPTETMTPTQAPTLVPTDTPLPTATALPSSTPTKTRVTASESKVEGSSDNPFLLVIFVVLWLTAVGYIGWSVWQRHQATNQNGR
ncbi:MAG: hypothetical protein ACUVR2_02795 [Anaerolineae bacterium]